MAKKFDVSDMSPREAYDNYNKANEICNEQGRLKKAIREEYLPMALDNKNSVVLFKDDDGVERGFDVKVAKSFKKAEFEKLLLAQLGKKVTDVVMGIYRDAMTGQRKSFGIF